MTQKPKLGVVIFFAMLAHITASIADLYFSMGFDYVIIATGILIFGLLMAYLSYNHFVRKFTKQEKEILEKQTTSEDRYVALGLFSYFVVLVLDRIFQSGYESVLLPLGVVVVTMCIVKVISDIRRCRSLAYDLPRDSENHDNA